MRFWPKVGKGGPYHTRFSRNLIFILQKKSNRILLKTQIEYCVRISMHRKILGLIQADDKDNIGMHLLGIGSNYLPEGMVVASKMLDAEITKAAKRQDALVHRLAGKFSKSGEPLPSDHAKLSDLRQDLQKQLLQSFSGSWKANGFGSQAEAEAFLTSSNNIQISTIMFLSMTDNSGDPGRHTPSTGGSVGIATGAGGIAP